MLSTVCYFFIFILLYNFVVSVLHQRIKRLIYVQYYLCTRAKSNFYSFSFDLLKKLILDFMQDTHHKII
jgi:hypothetical protein